MKGSGNFSYKTVRPKKKLGQHFLHDKHIAQQIVDSLEITQPGQYVLEVGPGTGVLTDLLLKKDNIELRLVEIDPESIVFLNEKYPQLGDKLIQDDVLSLSLDDIFPTTGSIIGNFPYNISSQIFFKVLEYRNHVDQVVCMIQKEVADRIASKPGNKTYGILSVLLQAYYSIEFLFKVSPGVFIPPPKVMSGVIRLKRNDVAALDCNEKEFVKVVKQGFNNRRKTLRNALKTLNLPAEIVPIKLLDKRAEQLSVSDFVYLTKLIEESRGGN